jgi:hypothetical protein
MIPVLSRPAASRRPAASAFSPADVAGLQLWLDASQIVGPSDGDPVGTWADAGGNGYDATAAGSARPTYAAAALGGKPGLLLDAADDGMSTALSLARPYTLFVVERPVVVDGNARRTLNSGSANNEISLSRDGLSCFVGGAVSPFSVGDTAGHLAALRVGAGGSPVTSFRVDGVERNNVGGGPASNDWPLVSIGAAGLVPEAGNTRLCEVIAYDSYLSDPDRQAVEQYLADKYAL